VPDIKSIVVQRMKSERDNSFKSRSYDAGDAMPRTDGRNEKKSLIVFPLIVFSLLD
jgi:hypothetical protein